MISHFQVVIHHDMDYCKNGACVRLACWEKQNFVAHVWLCGLQEVLCNDCGKKGQAEFHFVYHKCPHCASYNTKLV